MINTNSLTRKVLIYISAVSLFLLVVLMLMAVKSFVWGIGTGLKIELESEAALFAQSFKKNPNTALPRRPTMSAYSDLRTIPKSISERISIEEIRHKELLVFAKPVRTIGSWKSYFFCDVDVCEFTFFYPYRVGQDKWVYLIAKSHPDYFQQSEYTQLDLIILFILPIVMGCLVGLLFLGYRLGNQVSRPMQEIADWANGLSNENVDNSIPDFHFSELNAVAGNLHQAFKRISLILEREHKFLQYASHELRTPIAIINANIQLLDEVHSSKEMSTLGKRGWARLTRAALTMKDLTETLLWLSKEEETELQCPSVTLGDLAEQCVEDCRYLIQDKTVRVYLHFDEDLVYVPKTIAQIIISNLIRNAFQYTQDGEVRVSVTGAKFEIKNSCDELPEGSETTLDYGFGLGLQLVEKLVRKHHWRFSTEYVNLGRISTIVFATNSDL